MRIALCNEVLAELPFERQCVLAAALGYDGVEVAPFTLGTVPALTCSSAARRAGEGAERGRGRGAADRVAACLLRRRRGTSISHAEAAARACMLDVMERLLGPRRRSPRGAR